MSHSVLRSLRLAALIPALFALRRLFQFPEYVWTNAGLGDGTAWPTLQAGQLVASLALALAVGAALRATSAQWRVVLVLGVLAVLLPGGMRRGSVAAGPDELYLIEDHVWWVLNAVLGLLLTGAAAVAAWRDESATRRRPAAPAY